MAVINLVVCGLGKTGGRIAELASASKEFAVTGVCLDASKHAHAQFKVVSEKAISTALKGGGVFVDFTNAKAAMKNLPLAAKAGFNLVIGTTGFTKEQVEEIEKVVNQNKVSAVLAPNFSVGVNLFFKFAGEMAKALKNYDVEIVEAHHNEKKDAPSGTAMRAAKIVAQSLGYSESQFVFGRRGLVGPRGKEIGIHAVRAGNIVGEHTIIFAGNNEQVRLEHSAQSRDCFASGALVAAKWLSGKQGGKVHSMNDVLGI